MSAAGEQEHQRDGRRLDAPAILRRVAGSALATVGALRSEEVVTEIDVAGEVIRRAKSSGVEDREVVRDLIRQLLEELLALLGHAGSWIAAPADEGDENTRAQNGCSFRWHVI